MRGNLSIIIIAAEESGMEANVMYNDTSWMRLSIIKPHTQYTYLSQSL